MSSFIDLSPLNPLSELGFNIFSAACLALWLATLLSPGVEGASGITSGSGVVTSGAGRTIPRVSSSLGGGDTGRSINLAALFISVVLVPTGPAI